MFRPCRGRRVDETVWIEYATEPRTIPGYLGMHCTVFDLTPQKYAHIWGIMGDVVVVVGNGVMSERDRSSVAQHDATVFRFNDLNMYRLGERFDVHVVRYPSARPPPRYAPHDVARWYVSPVRIAPHPDGRIVPIYESQYREANVLRADRARLFPDCADCAFCWHNATYAGPSTGAAVLSELQGNASVRRVDLYGMNWRGAPDMHVDFRDPTLVRRCCTKCVIHESPGRGYGSTLDRNDPYGTRVWVAAAIATPLLLVLRGGVRSFYGRSRS